MAKKRTFKITISGTFKGDEIDKRTVSLTNLQRLDAIRELLNCAAYYVDQEQEKSKPKSKTEPTEQASLFIQQ